MQGLITLWANRDLDDFQHDEQNASSHRLASRSADRRCGPSGDPRKTNVPFPIQRLTATGMFWNHAIVPQWEPLTGITLLKSRTLVTTGQW
jgi:hypothetical protein